MKLGGKAGSWMHACEQSHHISGALTQVNRIFFFFTLPRTMIFKMIHKNPKVALMQDAVTSAYAIKNKKKKKKPYCVLASVELQKYCTQPWA